MRWNIANTRDRAVASMPILMILVAGALTKTGHPDWSLAWIAGFCALLITADFFDSRRRNQVAL